MEENPNEEQSNVNSNSQVPQQPQQQPQSSPQMPPQPKQPNAQVPPQPRANANVNNSKPAEGASGICIAAMVLGIVSLVLLCFWPISLPCAVVAFILGLVGLKKPGRGMAIAGIVTGVITFVIMIIFFILIVVGVFTALDLGVNSSLSNYIDNYYSSSFYNYY